MSVPPYNPLPSVPDNVDPRFRYGDRPTPDNFRQSNARYYLPNQRDNRFEGLTYGGKDNECFDRLSVANDFVPCNTDSDCAEEISRWCHKGQAQYVNYQCVNAQNSTAEQPAKICDFTFNAHF